MSNEFKMVPVELTQEMKRAARNAPLPMILLDSISARQDLEFESRFNAAVAAAPESQHEAGLMVEESLRVEVDQLKARCDELEQGAMRYEWLRAESVPPEAFDELDAKIDDALSKPVGSESV
ncbi:hypothetical protein ALP05_03991 [Pseudomonas caricapapayae]|uniref:Uncharacterized protein n=1 Tax=Pseudomonas caricapapayae TaxID=46678 RepID=A0A3M6EVG5_9PSED|nr:hypothetical protein [Pseudomonas caricapapayae]RMV72200.1 hypothetical protein ALP05_03991 [Pseudomonas caricapapayae]